MSNQVTPAVRVRTDANGRVHALRDQLSAAERELKAADIQVIVERDPPNWSNTLNSFRVSYHMLTGTYSELDNDRYGWQDVLRLMAKSLDYPYYLINGEVYCTAHDGQPTGLRVERSTMLFVKSTAT